MKPRNPFYWFCPSDYYNSTRGWPRVARHAFRDLLDLQADRGGMIPGDLRDLARACDLKLKAFKVYWKDYIASKFIPVKGGFQNERLAVEMARTRAISKARAEVWRRFGDREAGLEGEMRAIGIEPIRDTLRSPDPSAEPSGPGRHRVYQLRQARADRRLSSSFDVPVASRK
jgi:hypothetical protein